MKENSPSNRPSGTEVLLIRHAPADTGGRVCGRRDVPLLPLLAESLEAPRRLIGPLTRHLVSPALRCRQSAEMLWPGAELTLDPRLWEQDFGAWEGLPSADLPDLGPLSRRELARHRPPGGESFADVCARVEPAMRALAGQGGRVGILAHAGTVRAALALALGDIGAALAFEIAPLSVTHLTLWPEGTITIRSVGAA